MIYAITLDRSEVGHVMPVVDELRAMGRSVRIVADEYNNLPTITHTDTVLCVGDRIQLLRYLVNECPTAKICQLHAGEETTTYTEDNRYRWAITALATKPMFATKEAAKLRKDYMYSGDYVGTPALEHADERVRDAKACQPLDGRDYVLFAMNAWLMSTEHYVNECLGRVCEEAARRGWWVYTVVPNREVDYSITVKAENQIVQEAYAINHADFQILMAGAHLMIGNSSAGVIEAPSLGTQTIDIAPRQEGRPRASSILTVDEIDDKGRPSINYMRELFDKALSLDFSRQPYNRTAHPARMAAESVVWAEESSRLIDDKFEEMLRWRRMKYESAKEHDK